MTQKQRNIEAYTAELAKFFDQQMQTGLKDLSQRMIAKYGMSGVINEADHVVVEKFERGVVALITKAVKEIGAFYERYSPELSRTLYIPRQSDIDWLDLNVEISKIVKIKTGIDAFVKKNSRVMRAIFQIRRNVPGLLMSKFGTGSDAVIAKTNADAELLDTQGNVVKPEELIEVLNNTDSKDPNVRKLWLTHTNIEFKSEEVEDLIAI